MELYIDGRLYFSRNLVGALLSDNDKSLEERVAFNERLVQLESTFLQRDFATIIERSDNWEIVFVVESKLIEHVENSSQEAA